MSERTYKQAFVMSAVICFVLASALAYSSGAAAIFRRRTTIPAL